MSTLHLHYNSFKSVLDLDYKQTNLITFTQKYPICRISDILTFIVLDVCHIINSYTFETIIYECKHNLSISHGKYKSSYCFRNEFDEFDIHVDNQISVNFYYTGSLSFDIGTENYIPIIFNEYMKYMYGKHNYININRNYAQSIHYIKKSDIHTTYSKDPYIKHDMLLYQGKGENIIYDIINHKQLKYLIIVLKCILDAI